jgi:membrane protein implicated in regulation of membrane protease activity
MSELWIWWIAAAVLIGAELVTGTFYLLAVGLAVAIGGLAAWLGYSHQVQFTWPGIAGVVLTAAAHQWRQKHDKPAPQQSLDVGQSVRVLGWNPDGTARVSYRGSTVDRRSSRRRTRGATRRCTSWGRTARSSSSPTAAPDAAADRTSPGGRPPCSG